MNYEQKNISGPVQLVLSGFLVFQGKGKEETQEHMHIVFTRIKGGYVSHPQSKNTTIFS